MRIRFISTHIFEGFLMCVIKRKRRELGLLEHTWREVVVDEKGP